MKKKFIFIIGIALLSSYACQKSKLYPTLPTSVTPSVNPAEPFSTPARITAQVLGLYSNLKSGQLYGGRYQVYNDVKADNWINSTANSITTYQTWTESVTGTSTEVVNLWSQAYTTIDNCNLFIDGMATYGASVVSPALATNYIAEAKFIRALAYYALMQMYCVSYTGNAGASPGIPLRLTGLQVYGSYSLAPSTVAQNYTQIISDLNAAETGLPLAYYTSGTTLDPVSNTIRAHKNSAIAFKTRVYLSMGQYANVITEANKIVTPTAPFVATSGVPFALQSSIANVFKSPYTTTESIYSAPFTNGSTSDEAGGQNALADYFNSTGTTEYYINNKSALFTDAGWKTTDARRGFIITNTKTNTMNLTKWPLGSPYLDWANVMRYSEVLLNLAEARSQSISPTDPQAVALLNAVRQRSDPSTVFTTATQAQILEERNIEFLGEGLRWADLLRLGLPIPAKSNVPNIPVAGYGSTYIWPMSGNEQQTNSLIGR
jgi:hypothetical protein